MHCRGTHWNTARWLLALILVTLASGVGGCDSSDPVPLDTHSSPPGQDVTSQGQSDLLDPERGKPACAGTFRIEDLEGNAVAPPSEDTDWLFDQSVLRTFDVEMDPEDWAYLKAHALDEEYLPANLVFEGRRYKGLGIRFKGAWSSLEGCFEDGVQICPKLSMKMRFDKYDSCGRFYDLRRLVFNSGLGDRTMMREPLMYGIFNNVGIDVPRVSHALLRVNGEPLSLFVLVEPIDKEFIQDRYADDEGNLYKQAWPNHFDEWVYTQALRTNESTGDISRILGLADAIVNSSDADFVDAVSQYLDLEQIARTLAVGRVISDEDGLTRFWCFDMFGTCENHNFYWYDEPGVGFHLLPWDMDVTFYGTKPAHQFAAAWWEKPEQCGPVPMWVLEDPDNPDPDDSELVLPPQCDRLMNMTVMHHTAAYNASLAALVPALEQARTDLESFRTKIQTELMADPLYLYDLPGFTNEVDWFKKKIGEQIDELNGHLATLP